MFCNIYILHLCILISSHWELFLKKCVFLLRSKFLKKSLWSSLLLVKLSVYRLHHYCRGNAIQWSASQFCGLKFLGQNSSDQNSWHRPVYGYIIRNVTKNESFQINFSKILKGSKKYIFCETDHSFRFQKYLTNVVFSTKRCSIFQLFLY